MTPDDLPTARTLARRAGLTLLATGLLALLVSGVVLLFAVMLPQVQNNPGVREQLAELQQQLHLSPEQMRVAMLVPALMCGGYAVAALVVATGLLASGRSGWRTAATVLCGLVLTLMTLNALASLLVGHAADLIGAVLLAAPHALAMLWLAQARTAPDAATTDPAGVVARYVPPPYRPMQDYYLPPLPPPGRA